MESASRFDDPIGIYQTIYAASTRYDAYIAALAGFRPGPNCDLINRIDLTGDDSDFSDYPGPVTRWILKRYIGEGTLSGQFADLTHPSTIAFLKTHFATRFELSGVSTSTLDPDSIMNAPRKTTMEISRCISELEDRGFGRFDGLSYRSRLNSNIRRWAIFDKDVEHPLSAVIARSSSPISPDDSDLIRALGDLNIDTAPRFWQGRHIRR